jgi:hypothetical protein
MFLGMSPADLSIEDDRETCRYAVDIARLVEVTVFRYWKQRSSFQERCRFNQRASMNV